jgi:hypothetical protein
MYACIPTIGADFSAGCAGQRIGHLLFVTPPPPHDPRIDFCESQHHREQATRVRTGQVQYVLSPIDGNPLCLSFYRRLLAAASVARPTTT